MLRLSLIGSLVALLGSTAPARADAPVVAQARVGAGIAQRAISAPSAEGPRELELGPVPALMLGIDADVPTDSWTFGLGLSYRSSVLGRVADIDATASKTAVRSHNFEAGLRGGLRLGGVTLALFGGYGVRAFASVAVLRVPRSSLHGPVLRLEIDLPLKAAHMRVRVAPELQWIAGFSRELGITQPAFAVGGIAQLQLPLNEQLMLALDYRESRAFAHAFSDIERYLLLTAAFRTH